MSQASSNVLKRTTISCGTLCKTNACDSREVNLIIDKESPIPSNITARFDRFIDKPELLNDRVMDLLNIATYVFCADRLVNRGRRDSLTNPSWGRSLHFRLPVIDYEFWSETGTAEKLASALAFMTGDREYNFEFVREQGHTLKDKPYQLSMFSETAVKVNSDSNIDIVLFSGGLDSLAGVVERLAENRNGSLLLVSHVSNTKIKKTQRILVAELRKLYGDRIFHYTFECSFRKIKSADETQRTRMFLFSAIAASIAFCCKKSRVFVYENGVTSINLPKQTDLMNARASRTTHPKTLALLEQFYRCFDAEFSIIAPYRTLTKKEVVEKFGQYDCKHLIQNAISCSATRKVSTMKLHCGSCSQCLDRKIAMFSAGYAEDFDPDLLMDMGSMQLDQEAIQRLNSTLVFSDFEIGDSKFDFWKRYPTELNDVFEYWGGTNQDCLSEVFGMLVRYRDSVNQAVSAIQNSSSSIQVSKRSFLDFVCEKSEYDRFQHARFESRILSSTFVLLYEDKNKYSQGSSFYLVDYGLLTSHHVAKDNGIMSLCYFNRFPNSLAILDTTNNIICWDKDIDYALFDILQECEDFFPIGNSDDLRIGDAVTLIGYPLFSQGNQYTLLKAEIESKRTYFDGPLFTISRTIRHGFSGGVVLNSERHVVGLVKAGKETLDEVELASSINGFVPINAVLTDIQRQGG